MSKKKSLLDGYRFPGFRPRATLKGILGDPKARIIRQARRQKKTACGECGSPHRGFYDRKIRRIRDLSCGEMRIYLEVEVRRVRCRRCGTVKQEKFPWRATNPFYTKRLAWYVGRRCRGTAVKDVAKELKLDWKTVKSLEKAYMREQLRRTGTPSPKAIGIDEISIKKGHPYRIVVRDLVRRRPIWFGGVDRSEQSMDLFYQWLEEKKAAGIRLAVMDNVAGLRDFNHEACAPGRDPV